jgi:uncharacterized Zn finger protein
MIAAKPAQYGDAVKLLKDLEEVSRRDGRTPEFRRRIRGLSEDHARKGNLIRRLDDAGWGSSR